MRARRRQVLVVVRGEVHEAVHEAVHATAHPDHAPGAQMVSEQLRRVAGLGRLLRREEPVLGRRDLEEVVPVRRSGGRLTHAETLSQALVSCAMSLRIGAVMAFKTAQRVGSRRTFGPHS